MTDQPIYDMTIKAGEDFSFAFYLHNEDGTDQDLTGKSYRAQLREFAESPIAYDFVCSHNNQGGRVDLTIPHEMTAALRFKKGVYDVLENGTNECKLCGSVEIIPAVTR